MQTLQSLAMKRLGERKSFLLTNQAPRGKGLVNMEETFPCPILYVQVGGAAPYSQRISGKFPKIYQHPSYFQLEKQRPIADVATEPWSTT